MEVRVTSIPQQDAEVRFSAGLKAVGFLVVLTAAVATWALSDLTLQDVVDGLVYAFLWVASS